QQWRRVLGHKLLPDDHYAVYRSLTRFAYPPTNDVEQAKAAVRSIGTAAIPFLLDWGQSENGRARKRSFLGFEALGPAAAKAIPTLAQRLVSTNEAVACIAAYSLNGIGPPALPALLNAITNRYHGIRFDVLWTIDLSPKARPIIPTLLNDLE